MSGPEPGGLRDPDRKAEFAQGGQRGGEASGGGSGPDPSTARYAHPEAQLGGADAVQKTSYVVGEGTEPGSQPRGPYTARRASSGGVNVAVWIVGAIAVAIALVYALGLFR